MRFLFLLLFAAQAAAQPAGRLVQIDYDQLPPADWPALEIRTQQGSFEDVKRWCNQPPEIANRSVGCSKVHFEWGFCMIFVTESAGPELVVHEEAHCRGYVHKGERNAKVYEAWEKFKRTGKQ